MTAMKRRKFLGSAGAALMLAAAPAWAEQTGGSMTRSMPFDLSQPPESVAVFAGPTSRLDLKRRGDEWSAGDTLVSLRKENMATSITVSAPSVQLTHIKLRWKGKLPDGALLLGDAWERSYGDLAWEGCRPERVLPWYAAISAGSSTAVYGVLCGASAFAFWQVEPEGLALWLDVRNGGSGVQLGQRHLSAASFTALQGDEGEGAQRVLTRFCARLSPEPRKMQGRLIGTNDWYYAYGHNTATGIERDADFIVSLMPANAPRPFTIVDDGWTNASAFPDMRALARSIRGRGARPGIWIRPLQAHKDVPTNLLLPDTRFGTRKERGKELAFDPTIPEALARVLAKVEQVVDWGYELVKHDFTTYELFGQWGGEMGASPTLPGWQFHDRSLTNAEIALHLYEALRKKAGDSTCIIGCNTVGHLAAGLFEANRTGDDVSGKQWERTRRMGVNTLAFRLPQNNTFFVQDADCVPLTRAVNWRETSQWLDAVARSGSALILSPEPDAIGPEQRAAVREALQEALVATLAEPLDWLESTAPERWRYAATGTREVHYEWGGPGGASPFPLE